MKRCILILLLILGKSLLADYNYQYPENAKELLVSVSGAHNDLRQLRIFEYPGAGISVLPEHIGEFYNLRLLALTRGAFRTIPESIYNTKQLRALDFHYANIMNLQNDMQRWKLLVSLQLEYNEMTELPAKFGLLHNLRVLHLKGVRLKEMPESVSKLSKLNFVHISASHEDLIRKISKHLIAINDDSQSAWAHYLVKRNIYIRNEQKTLPPKPKAKYLLTPKSALVENGRLDLSVMNAKLFDKVLNRADTRSLYLGYNQLETLPEALRQYTQLEYLDCSVNEISELPEWMRDLNQLEEVSLASNCLKQFPDQFLTSMKNIESIDLSNNKIERLPSTMDNQISLKSMDLSGNLIKEIPNSFIDRFPQLEQLVLYGNILDSKTLNRLLSDNPEIEILY